MSGLHSKNVVPENAFTFIHNHQLPETRSFIMYLTRKLENECDLKGYVTFRDSGFGKTIFTQQVKAIETSLVTLLVIDEEVLKNGWPLCLNEDIVCKLQNGGSESRLIVMLFNVIEEPGFHVWPSLEEYLVLRFDKNYEKSEEVRKLITGIKKLVDTIKVAKKPEFNVTCIALQPTGFYQALERSDDKMIEQSSIKSFDEKRHSYDDMNEESSMGSFDEKAMISDTRKQSSMDDFDQEKIDSSWKECSSDSDLASNYQYSLNDDEIQVAAPFSSVRSFDTRSLPSLAENCVQHQWAGPPNIDGTSIVVNPTARNVKVMHATANAAMSAAESVSLDSVTEPAPNRNTRPPVIGGEDPIENTVTESSNKKVVETNNEGDSKQDSSFFDAVKDYFFC